MWRWFRIGLAAAACLLLLLALWTPSQRRGPPLISRSVTLSDFDAARALARSDEAPSLLVDKDNPNLVYLSDVDLSTSACQFSVSLDGGRTWRKESAPQLDPYTRNCAMGTGHPQNLRTELKQGPDGTFFYVFQGNDAAANGSRSVLVSRSTDGGRSWSTTVVDTGPRAADPADAILNFEGHLAVDPGNPKLVYVMWRRSYPIIDPAVRPKPTRAFYAVSQDGGATFGPATQLLDFDLAADGPRPVIVGSAVYAFYRQAAPPLPTEASALPSATPPLTRLFAATSRDQGRTWARSEIAAARDASEPVPVYDPARKQFDVVWHDNRRDELDVWFSTSADGVSWSQPKLLNDDPRGMRVGQYYPQISLSPTGRLDVAWYDFRDDPFPAPAVGPGNVLGTFSDRGKVASVYLTSSRDGGKTWTPNVRVNDQLIDRTVGTWANNYDVLAPPTIASTPRGAVVGWSDTRNATVVSQAQDIAVATVTFETSTAPRVTGLQAALVGVLVGSGIAMWGALLLVRRPVQ